MIPFSAGKVQLCADAGRLLVDQPERIRAAVSFRNHKTGNFFNQTGWQPETGTSKDQSPAPAGTARRGETL